jgi:hypothetical protein
MRYLIDHLWQPWKVLEMQIDELSAQIDSIAKQDAACGARSAMLHLNRPDHSIAASVCLLLLIPLPRPNRIPTWTN